MKSKRFMTLLIFGMFVMLGSGVFAYYVMSHQSTAQVTIQGGVSAFGITADLSDITISVNESLTNTQQIILENDNSNLTMFYNLTTIVNVTDGNCSGQNDVSFELESLDDGVIDQGGNFTMRPGTNVFNFTATAINDRSCPSIIDVTLDFTE